MTERKCCSFSLGLSSRLPANTCALLPLSCGLRQRQIAPQISLSEGGPQFSCPCLSDPKRKWVAYVSHSPSCYKSQAEGPISHQKPGSPLFFFCLFAFSRPAPAAYEDSQARGPIGAVAIGLRQSCSNAGSEPRLQPTAQLTAMPDP